MTDVDLVIVGGGHAGHAAFAAYREAGGKGPVVLISEDEAAPYRRPPLSKGYLRGESGEDELSFDSVEFYTVGDDELLLDDSVVSLDAGTRSIRTRAGREFTYQNCILATGGEPNTLPVTGGEKVPVLRWLAQARGIRDQAQSATSAVVVGSGFVGCEVAASLAARGISVTMVSTEERPQLNRLGPDAADLITKFLTDAGVTFHGETEVVDVKDGSIVELSDGTSLLADLVVAAVGISPRVELAEQAGADIRNGRVVVDQQMRTSVAGLFAVGDVALAFNTTAGRHLVVEHWANAEQMGKVAATTATGDTAEWGDAPGFFSQIGSHTLKYKAWGDGFDQSIAVRHENGGTTIWYVKDGVTVGVLTDDADDDFTRGADLVLEGAPSPV
ncbi:NADPH-dependent 2,4-dienoyl-CoA reductase/sulfur reductase-like enzyme [Nakamurella sp. UYEF19]|uniref:NAD(P)/FAD-dependent oxidoreductase n=1 Tax=Nakamurella sp. UYEF19 TaxID=1756392 RepID=UPI003392D57D